jgi:phenylpropionate dioxygenase-like ring-hydroxylating dioxygenase large terminal subunit
MPDRSIPETMIQCDAINYQEILDVDTRPVPDCLRERRVPDIGTAPVPTAHYTDPEIFKRSIEKVWLRTWQMACREEEIPAVGDYHVFDLVGRSLIIVRSGPDEIKALHNSCLHRGRKLVTQDGTKAEFRCPFHGFTWKNDGVFLLNPIEWDFAHCPSDTLRLPEAKVARWGGFVFVNFAPDPPPLHSVLDPIPPHFARWAFEDKYIFAHVGKRAPANWMVAQEAFMETHHSIGTHPQIMPFITDANAQYDIFSPMVTRHISGRGFQSPFITDRVLTQHEIAGALLGQGAPARGAAKAPMISLPEGSSARAYVADLARQGVQTETGYDLANVADCELGDSLIYNVFPNFSVWGGVAPNLVYRWKPVGLRHDASTMEVYILKRVPKGGERPKPAPFILLEDDQPWASVADLGGLGPVVDQDWANMEAMQQGLMASETKVLQLGHYLEMRIRQTHDTFESYLDDP